MTKKQLPEVFCERGILKKFAVFTGKKLCWSVFGGLQVCNFIKKESNTDVFL